MLVPEEWPLDPRKVNAILKNEKAPKLGAAGLRAYFNVAEAWGLSEAQAARLLDSSCGTYARWKREPEHAHLDIEHFERLSLILGIYKDLHILLPRDDAADSWVLRPNRNPIFQRRSPLELMLAGQINDLVLVRRHLDGQKA